MLKSEGKSRAEYNQIANYAYTQDAINIKVGSKSPHIYFADMVAQCNGGPLKYGSIDSQAQLDENLLANCLPTSAVSMSTAEFSDFLRQRRKLMAEKIKAYYFAL